jgi:hypothetical protein
MFFLLNPVFWCDIRNDKVNDRFCASCKRSVSKANYEDVYMISDKFKHALDLPSAKGLDYWPMALRSFSSILLHEQVVKAFFDEEITGALFHKISRIEGKVLNDLGSPPDYYLIEPLNYYEFIPSPDEFDILVCGCGAQQKKFGEFKQPFELKKDSWNGSDIFSIKNVNYRSWICITKNIVKVLLKNNWQNQFWIGSSAFPGMTIKYFNDSWYEDTREQIKVLFPNITSF